MRLLQILTVIITVAGFFRTLEGHTAKSSHKQDAIELLHKYEEETTVWDERKVRDHFVIVVDTNQDGTVDGAEYQAFIDWLKQRSTTEL